MRTIADVIKRVRSERAEMKWLRPIPSLVQRLHAIELRIWQMMMGPLLKSKALTGRRHGRYPGVTEQQASAHPAPQVVQSDDTRSVRETLMLRQPERRRSRSDNELRKERAQWEKQWEQQWNEQHPPRRDSPS
jgi:hypothetical protein